MKTLLIILFWGWSMLSVAQTVHPWEQALGEWISLQDEESEHWETFYDDLCERASHPCNLNTATREELEELPFLRPSGGGVDGVSLPLWWDEKSTGTANDSVVG